MPKAPSRGVALLAPVPVAYLAEGASVVATHGKVAFGSRAFDVFQRLDTLRDGLPIDVWIYASHGHAMGPPKVTWRARYVGHVQATTSGAHPAGTTFRPPSTVEDGEDRASYWAVFWEVEDLRALGPDEIMAVTSFQGLERRARYAKTFVPEGPLLVQCP